MSNWGTDRESRDRTTAELVVDTVRGQIERGQLRPGQRLPPERELAARLRVSRPSVRTGLRTLVTMGILRTRHGSGTFVTDGPPRLDVRALHLLSALHGFRPEHLDEARRLLEVAVAGLAAERAGGEQLMPLAEHVSGMFASIEDPKVFAAHDAAFHRAIGTAAGNPILASIVEMVTRLSFEQSRGLTGRGPDDLRSVALMRRNIYHAVRSRDVERARREMAQHLPRPARTASVPQGLAGAAS
jgi:GntR family transcriptional regulator, transcriptional repressor for pyruvate dehydrogenase complex